MSSSATRSKGKYQVHHQKAVQAIQKFDFGEDNCSINCYAQKRMQDNDISKITNMERPDISPGVYSLLKHCQPTTTSV